MNDRNHPERIRNVTNFTGHPIDTLIILSTLTIGIIVSFSWRDAIDKWLHENFSSVDTKIQARFIYALSATVFAVIMIYIFSKIKRHD
jgi:uncharacterized membrane protein SirB2